jgi:hypothetical protein
MTRKIFLLCAAILSAIVALTYAPALRLNFYGDDYSFLEIAGRSSLAQYLAFYFDPRAQTGWYRPMQGMVFGIEWILFGGNPLGYHLVNVLVHLGNCWLLFALVWRVARNWRAAFIAALIYAGLPLYAVAVFWPGDADFLLTFFYLLSFFFWTLHLQERKTTFYFLSFTFFLLALLTKEFAVTLPVVLFLADRLLVRDAYFFARRYAPFILVLLIYLPLEYYIQSRSVLTNLYGYGIGGHVVSNFFGYLAALAFPWGLPEPFNYLWLAMALVLFAFALVTQRNASLLFLALASALAFLPVISFPWFFTRYLYMSVMASAVVIALLFDFALTRLAHSKWFARAGFAALALIVFGNGIGVAQAAADFAELGRQTRVPFRDITQRHPTFPDDTYLYFINPPTITSQLSGMFFLRYGQAVTVASDQAGARRANLREHKNAFVIYFDEEKRTREMPVAREIRVTAAPAPPVDFAAPIRLEGFELASGAIKRGEPIIILLYWRATGRIEKDISVVLNLVDAMTSQRVTGGEQSPTQSWLPGNLIVDVRVLVVPRDAALGDNYRLQVQVNDRQTLQPLTILQSGADKVVIEPLSIEDAK